MSPWLGIAILWLTSSTTVVYQATATFQLNREGKDRFTNPHCVKKTDCSPSQCAQYFARCETGSNCTDCVCDEQTPTFFEKRCMKDDDIIPQTVPRYSSFVISKSHEEPYMTASTKRSKLEEQSQYTGNLNQLWLYTPSRKLMNLKTLECLDSGDPKEVLLRPCTAENNETQEWYCSPSNELYSIKKGVPSYLQYLGTHFQMGSNKQNSKWIANKGTGFPSRSICDIPDAYKGCYRFTDGSSVKRFTSEFSEQHSKTCTECYETFIISAPIFTDGYSSTCFLRWNASQFSVNNQLWKTLVIYEDDFGYIGKVSKLGGIEFRFLKRVKSVWAGSLIKLQVECKDYNPNTKKTTHESHFVLLKFDGVFRHQSTSPPTKPKVGKSKRASLHAESRYKSAVIALSVVLAAVLILVIVAAVMIYRRQGTKTWITTNGEEDISAKPFCDSENNL